MKIDLCQPQITSSSFRGFTVLVNLIAQKKIFILLILRRFYHVLEKLEQKGS